MTDQPHTDILPGDNRPPVYWEGQTLIIRASALGTECLWELVAAGQGYEPALLPASLVRAFKEGHDLEPAIIREMEFGGWRFLSRQVEGELHVGPKIKVRYHPDGEAIPLDKAPQEYIVEVKALGLNLWTQAVRHGTGATITTYPWQLSVMMHGLGLPAVWVAYCKGNPPDPETGVREPSEHDGEIHYEYVKDPPISLADIEARAYRVYELVTGEDIVTSGRECDSPGSWPCRYLHLRPEPETDGRESYLVPDHEKEEVDRLLREYMFSKGQADELKRRADEARDRLIAIAGPHRKLVTDKHIIPITKGSNSYYKTKNMPEEVKEILEQYKGETRYKYIGKVKNLG